MPLTIFTSRLSYRGDDALDITRKTGTHGLPFAPSWTLLNQALARRRNGKNNREAWMAYREKYIAEMRLSYVMNRTAWDSLLSRDIITVCCYCVNAAACHRIVLARDILTKLGATYEGER